MNIVECFPIKPFPPTTESPDLNLFMQIFLETVKINKKRHFLNDAQSHHKCLMINDDSDVLSTYPFRVYRERDS